MVVHTVVVGGRHHDGAIPRTCKLRKGEALVLMREPSNPYDKNAVAVMATDGQKLGYIPRQDAPLVAKALDSNLEVSAICRAAGTTSMAVTWDN